MFCPIPLPSRLKIGKYRLRLKRAMVKVPSVPLLTVLWGSRKLSHTGLLMVFCQVEFPFRLLMLAGCPQSPGFTVSAQALCSRDQTHILSLPTGVT